MTVEETSGTEGGQSRLELTIVAFSHSYYAEQYMEFHRTGSGTEVVLEPDSLLDRLPEAKTVEDVWSACTDFFGAHGLDRLIYIDMPAGGFAMHTTFPESWLNHYRESGYERIDPFFSYCCTTTTPTATGADYLSDYPYLTAAERRLILEAGEAGMRAGVSCTVRKAGAGGVGGWNLGSSLPRPELEKILAEHGSMLRLAALYGHERLLAHRENADGRGLLSPRESECLQWTARGLRTKEIAARMGLRPVTVELYLKNARRKLNAATREQAVAIALTNGHIGL